MARKSADHHNLNKSEFYALEKLREEIQCDLPRIEEYDFENQGFEVHNRQIVSLQFHNIKLTSIPKSIEHFSSLRNLILENNEISDVDLRLISKNSDLRYIDLENNKIEKIDLSPIQQCNELTTFTLDDNQLQSIDLTPLRSCRKLRFLSLENKRLQTIDLSFIDSQSNLETLVLRENSIRQLDITPLLSLEKLRSVSIDLDTELVASSLNRDYSLDQSWFIRDYLPRVSWILSEEDNKHQSLFDMYNKIIQNFRHEEFWADYRDRRLATPINESPETKFFEFAVDCYVKIKDRPFSKDPSEIKEETRQQIKDQFRDQFLPKEELLPVLKDYFEFNNEPVVAVEAYEDGIVIFHFWMGGSRHITRVHTFSWAKIVVNASSSSYQVQLGFNHGYLRAGEKFHPFSLPEADRPPVYDAELDPLNDEYDPEDDDYSYPSDVFTTTEVSYDASSFHETDVFPLLSRLHAWLKRGYYPNYSYDSFDVFPYAARDSLGF